MPTTATTDREALGELPNPMGLLGVEFIEYNTSRPQTLGHSLERLGFRPVARHRSREVLLYRQGDMHIVVNAHRPAEAAALPERARIAAVALRVRDAASAYRRALERGAWAVPTQVEVMELNIPAIHGVGDSRLYFVDRVGEFSIYDVDFVPIPGVDPRPPALGDMRLFGVVQYIGFERLADWTAFYAELLGFKELPPEAHFGVLTQGRILASPCGTLHWQLIEPAIDAVELDTEEMLERIALGTPDVLATVAALKARGVEFVESASGVRTESLGAVTRSSDAGPSFEFVRDPR